MKYLHLFSDPPSKIYNERFPFMEYNKSFASAGIEWLDQMAQPNKWDLTDEDLSQLLGGLPANVYRELKGRVIAGQRIEVTEDVVERIALLLEIFKGLQCIVPHERIDLSYAWFSQPNTGSLFGGVSIKEFLLRAKNRKVFLRRSRLFDVACWALIAEGKRFDTAM